MRSEHKAGGRLWIIHNKTAYKMCPKSNIYISDRCFKLLLGTLPCRQDSITHLLQFNTQYESKMESLYCSYIVFDAILRRGEIKRCVIAAGRPVCLPDVVWEMLIDLLMKSGIHLSILSLRESVTLEGKPGYVTRWQLSCSETQTRLTSLILCISLSHRCTWMRLNIYE